MPAPSNPLALLLEARRRCNTPDFDRALAALRDGDFVAVPRATLARLVAAFDVTAQPPDVRCRDLWTAARALGEVKAALDALDAGA